LRANQKATRIEGIILQKVAWLAGPNCCCGFAMHKASETASEEFWGLV